MYVIHELCIGVANALVALACKSILHSPISSHSSPLIFPHGSGPLIFPHGSGPGSVTIFNR